MNTLSELRKACKESGIQVKRQTLSHGIHLKFLFNGISSNAINFNHEKTIALNEIKDRFKGLTIDGQKVYGISK